MKKFILSGILTLIFFGSLSAQEAEAVSAGHSIHKLRFGLYIGGGTSNLNPTSSTSNSANDYQVRRLGGQGSFGFGLSGEKRIDRRYSVYSGLGLNWMGGRIIAENPKFTTQDSNTYARKADITYKLQYINVPIGLKLNATNIKKTTIHCLIGMQTGFVIGRTSNYDINTTTGLLTNNNEKLKPLAVTPFSLGYQVGLGSEFKVSSDNSASAALIYTNGFIDHTNPTKLGKTNANFNDGIVRSNNIHLRFGFFF